MLRNSWEQARDRAAQSVDEGYLRDLQKLLGVFTKGGQLEEAIAVKNESQSVVKNAGATAARGAVTFYRLPAFRTWYGLPARLVSATHFQATGWQPVSRLGPATNAPLALRF
jgi:hypothetical protein